MPMLKNYNNLLRIEKMRKIVEPYTCYLIVSYIIEVMTEIKAYHTPYPDFHEMKVERGEVFYCGPGSSPNVQDETAMKIYEKLGKYCDEIAYLMPHGLTLAIASNIVVFTYDDLEDEQGSSYDYGPKIQKELLGLNIDISVIMVDDACPL